MKKFDELSKIQRLKVGLRRTETSLLNVLKI